MVGRPRRDDAPLTADPYQSKTRQLDRPERTLQMSGDPVMLMLVKDDYPPDLEERANGLVRRQTVLLGLFGAERSAWWASSRAGLSGVNGIFIYTPRELGSAMDTSQWTGTATARRLSPQMSLFSESRTTSVSTDIERSERSTRHDTLMAKNFCCPTSNFD